MVKRPLTRAALEALQEERLQTLLSAVIPANPFYAQKLATAGVGPEIPRLQDFVGACPFTTKAELVEDQRVHPPYGTNLTYPLHRYTRFHQTSGTAGLPLRWLDTPESWQEMVGNWMGIYRAAGVGPADRVFFAFTFGPFIGFWMAFEAATQLGCLCLPGGGLSSGARLRMILDNEVTVLCCTPTYALRLAEVARGESIDLRLSRVKLLIVAGEPGGSVPAVRARLQELWPGARVFDHHGMTEVGPVTHECPARPGCLHVLESAYLAEVIEPQSGRAVPPGAVGELVLTTLGRIGSPLLRYRTGDLVRAVGPDAAAGEARCSCGRSELVLAGGILGRADDMLIVRGVNVFPSAVEEVIRASGQVAEFQVTVTSEHNLSELQVQLEPVPGCADPTRLGRKVQQSLQDVFALRVPVTVVGVGTLPRFEMKAKRWTRTTSNPG
jgi:phenylacetate-CoA ligase